MLDHKQIFLQLQPRQDSQALSTTMNKLWLAITVLKMVYSWHRLGVFKLVYSWGRWLSKGGPQCNVLTPIFTKNRANECEISTAMMLASSCLTLRLHNKRIFFSKNVHFRRPYLSRRLQQRQVKLRAVMRVRLLQIWSRPSFSWLAASACFFLCVSCSWLTLPRH